MAPLISKPGITRLAVSSAVPKEWSQSWFRDFVSDYVKGADVRNAVGANGIVITGNLTSPYATIALGGTGPIILTNDITINPVSGTPLTVKINGTTLFVVNGTAAPTIQGYGPTAAGLVDMTPDVIPFTGTLTGLTTTVTVSCVAVKMGPLVMLFVGTGTGQSNSTSLGMTGIPNEINPTRQQSLPLAIQNSLENAGASATAPGVLVNTNNTLSFYINGTTTGFTNTATTKGINGMLLIPYILS